MRINMESLQLLFKLYLHFMRLLCPSDATKFVIQLELSRKNELFASLNFFQLWPLFPCSSSCRGLGFLQLQLQLPPPLLYLFAIQGCRRVESGLKHRY